MNYGKYLRTERIKQNLTQQQLADKTGVTKRTIAYWENGKRNMSINNADMAFKALNISLTIGKQ